MQCPLCGAPPEAQHVDEACDANVDGIIQAAAAEILKVEKLKAELADTVSEVKGEASELEQGLAASRAEYEQMDSEIQESVAPEVGEARAAFTVLVEQRAGAQKAADLYARVGRLEERKRLLLEEDSGSESSNKIAVGMPDPVAFSFSQKVSNVLRTWNFPGECDVHYDKTTADFVIDGKPRDSRGKGLRAITHAAVTIALLEYCQEQGRSHPGFVVLDSPLLAYFKPEGDDDLLLEGTDLKERFYQYIVEHHATDSQVLIVENTHPPSEFHDDLSMTVFTGNPNEGRFGFL